MNEEQVLAFTAFWADLVDQCQQTFPEAVKAVDLEGQIASCFLDDTPVADQRQAWVSTMNGILQLMPIADLEDTLWAKAIVFRWIWDWELAQASDAVLSFRWTVGG